MLPFAALFLLPTVRDPLCTNRSGHSSRLTALWKPAGVLCAVLPGTAPSGSSGNMPETLHP